MVFPPQRLWHCARFTGIADRGRSMQSGRSAVVSANTDIGRNGDVWRFAADPHASAHRNTIRAGRGDAPAATDQPGVNSPASSGDCPTDVCSARADVHIDPVFHSHPLPHSHPDEHTVCIQRLHLLAGGRQYCCRDRAGARQRTDSVVRPISAGIQPLSRRIVGRHSWFDLRVPGSEWRARFVGYTPVAGRPIPVTSARSCCRWNHIFLHRAQPTHFQPDTHTAAQQHADADGDAAPDKYIHS
ncbi:MAG: hypothetical protein A4E28_01956 [Methanocella sp. PtaU1.Bin125]|nr:MAG: hypothetical protein A4E28_01956 [Methanocella sp. PtaU1.Bin125]